MDLEVVIGFREKLRRLEREIVSQLKNETGCCGVSIAQCHIINELGTNSMLSLVELSDTLGLDTSTMSRNINVMVDNGLVCRNINEKDRRYITLSLTERGCQKFRYIQEICNTHYYQVLKKVPSDKLTQVIESFDLIVDAILETKLEKGSDNTCCTSKE